MEHDRNTRNWGLPSLPLRSRIIPITLLALAILFSLSARTTTDPGLSQAPGEVLLYSQDFESGPPAEWELDPGWQIVEITGGHALSGTGHVWAGVNVGPWGDYRLRFRVKAEGAASVHANYRITQNARYFIGLNPDGLYLQKQVGDTFFEGLASAPGLSSGWHTVEIAGAQFIAGHWHWPAWPPYDCDGDGIITVADIMCVIEQLGANCP